MLRNFTIISVEQESGSSVLIEMQGILGFGSSVSPPPTTVEGQETNFVLKSNGDDAEIDEEVGEADPDNEIPD